jgi:hypothetical protein
VRTYIVIRPLQMRKNIDRSLRKLFLYEPVKYEKDAYLIQQIWRLSCTPKYTEHC